MDTSVGLAPTHEIRRGEARMDKESTGEARRGTERPGYRKVPLTGRRRVQFNRFVDLVLSLSGVCVTIVGAGSLACMWC